MPILEFFRANISSTCFLIIWSYLENYQDVVVFLATIGKLEKVQLSQLSGSLKTCANQASLQDLYAVSEYGHVFVGDSNIYHRDVLLLHLESMSF